MSESHKEVISGLLFFIREMKGFALVCGDVGTGKTMLVHHLLEKLSGSILPILIPYPDVEYIEILRYVARVLKIKTQGKGILELADDLKGALTKANLDDRQVVLIIDEAHLLSPGSLESIRLLSNIELTRNKLLQILLVGQSELGINLRKEGMRQIRQRININRVLSPLSPSETIEYIDHRLKIADSSFGERFEQSCRKLLYEMTEGVPRDINRLCDTALLVCMSEKGRKVTRSTLKKAYNALNADLIQARGDRRQKGLFSNAFSYAGEFKIAFAAAALTLVLALVLVGKDYLDERLKQWLYRADTLQEITTDISKRKLPHLKAKSQDTPSRAVGEDSSLIKPLSPMDHPILNSKPESAEAIGGEALNVKEIDSNVPAGNTVSPSEGGPVLTPKAPEETTDRTAGGDPGADRAAAEERKDVDAEPQSHDAGSTFGGFRFFHSDRSKGENLSKIAAQWFPEDADSARN